MELEPDTLKQQIKVLSAKAGDDGFLELGRALRALQEGDGKSFAAVLDWPEIGRRRGYYLVSISRAFDGLAVPDATLKALGWTKLQAIAPYVTAANVGELIGLAQQCTAWELEGLAKDLPREEEHAVLLRLNPSDYALFQEAMVAHGAVKSGRGLADKATAFRNLLEAALSDPGKSAQS